MKSVSAGLLAIAIATASVQGRIHKQHARGLRPHSQITKRTNSSVEPGVAYEALIGYGYQNGQEGACGQTYSDSDLVAGLSTLTYGQEVCGQCIQVTSTEGDSVVASVEDSCTPADEGELCHGYYDLYLSVGAFKQLSGGNLDAGLVNATWQLTDCPAGSGSASYAPVESSKQAFQTASQSAVDQANSQAGSTKTQEAYTAPAQTANAQQGGSTAQVQVQQAQVDTAANQANTWTQEASNTWTEAAAASSTESSEAAAATTASSTPSSGGWPATKFGVAWGVDNNFASQLSGGVISSYMHWKDGPVDGLDATYMPMLELSNDWYGEQFNSVIAGLSSPPSILLGQNEIDVDGTYADPSTAADYFRRYVTPHCGDGKLCCTPSITYEIDQLKQFMDACPDCQINCVQLHVYRPVTDDMAGDAQQWVEKAYNELGNLPVVISECGIDTRNGDASEGQVVQFMKSMASWANNLDWVVAVQWSGGFQAGNPWDSFLSSANALLSGSGLSYPGQCWKDGNFD